MPTEVSRHDCNLHHQLTMKIRLSRGLDVISAMQLDLQTSIDITRDLLIIYRFEHIS